MDVLRPLVAWTSSTHIEEKVGHCHPLSQAGCQSRNLGMNVREPGGRRRSAHLLDKGVIYPSEFHRRCGGRREWELTRATL
jgi:hypothetical protein